MTFPYISFTIFQTQSAVNRIKQLLNEKEEYVSLKSIVFA